MAAGFLRALSLLLAAALVMAAPANGKDQKQVEGAAFTAMQDRFKQGDYTIDIKLLRQQNAQHFGYFPPTWDAADEAFDALESDPEKTLKLAEEQLTHNYLDMIAHVAKERALLQLDREGEARTEHQLVSEILRSITQGREGTSAAESWNASSVSEEYTALALLGYQPTGQALSNSDGHTYDVMTVTDRETGEELEIWFEIDSFFGMGLF